MPVSDAQDGASEPPRHCGEWQWAGSGERHLSWAPHARAPDRFGLARVSVLSLPLGVGGTLEGFGMYKCMLTRLLLYKHGPWKVNRARTSYLGSWMLEHGRAYTRGTSWVQETISEGATSKAHSDSRHGDR